MAESGPSVTDIRKQITVDSLRRAPGVGLTPDPMDEAYTIAKKRAAISSLNQITSGGDADALRAANERLEVQIAHHQLEEKLAEIKKPESGASEWQTWLMGQVQELQGQIGQMRQEQNEAMQAALQERLNIMANELERLKTRPPEESPLVTARHQIEAARALVEYVQPPSRDIPPASDHTSLELRAWEKRVEIDQERWRAEREDRHNERLAEIEADRQLREQEIQVAQRRADQVERAITTTLPRLIDLGEQFMARFAGTQPAAGATAATPSVAAYAVPSVPPGCKSGPCQVASCGYPIVYREDWPAVQCPACGAQYNLTPDEPAPDNVIRMPAGEPEGYAWEQQGTTQEVVAPASAPFV